MVALAAVGQMADGKTVQSYSPHAEDSGQIYHPLPYPEAVQEHSAHMLGLSWGRLSDHCAAALDVAQEQGQWEQGVQEDAQSGGLRHPRLPLHDHQEWQHRWRPSSHRRHPPHNRPLVHPRF